MKFILINSVFIFLAMLLSSEVQAQLPSQRPASKMYSQQVRQKLAQPKPAAPANRTLPSESKLPSQVTAAKNKQKPQVKLSEAEMKKKLPSSSRKMPVVNKPRKP